MSLIHPNPFERPYGKVIDSIYVILSDYIFLSLEKIAFQIHYIKCSLNTLKCTEQEIMFLGRNKLEFFCVPLYTDDLSNTHKTFEVASSYNINVK